MRPTDIGIRSPENKTPAPLGMPVLSRTGSPVCFKASSGGFSFGSGVRFNHYVSDYKKSGFRVGPGCYELDQTAIGSTKASNTHVYRMHSRAKGLLDGCYYYSGDRLVYDHQLSRSVSGHSVRKPDRNSFQRTPEK